tara:strand:+ start:114 stop:344 length:231 start_codon:yes stop_codon:yes gene_type:complete
VGIVTNSTNPVPNYLRSGGRGVLRKEEKVMEQNKNCFISAHDSAHSLKSLTRVFELFFQNIENIQIHEPIENLYSE